jgi:hypothetical protein
MKTNQLFQISSGEKNRNRQTDSILYQKLSCLVDKKVEQKFPPLGDTETQLSGISLWKT